MNDDIGLGHAALYYAKRGLAVFPLKERDKLPATKNGCLDATKSATDIESWWEHEPGSNIGIACGATSMVVVMDIDAKSGGLTSLDELQVKYGKLPPTWTACTGGGGYHFYFKHPGAMARIPNSASKVAQGIDIRGDGGYVAAPPSVHPNGKPYLWEMGGNPVDVELAELPLWLRAKIVESPAERMQPKELPEVIAEGGRADAVTSFCGTLRRRGMGPAEIAEHARAWNARHCVPPLSDAQVDAIAGSAARYAPGDPLIQPATATADTAAPTGDVAPAPEKPAGKGRRGGSKELTGPVLQATLEEDLPRFLAEHNISVNAIGELVDAESNGIASLRIDELVLSFANTFRRSRQYVSKQYVEEILSDLVRERAKQRREFVAKQVLAYRCGTAEALAAWVKAVTGEAGALDIAVMAHWLWMVKRSLAGLTIEHSIMPILLGPQASGKSTAAKMLCAPLMELACVPASGELITDPRSIPALGKYYAGVWDEMEGADRGSIEAIKRTITSAKLTFKPLYTNTNATIRVTMQWLGTSNKSVASMIKDATGNRRFYELKTLQRCDWDALGKINYADLWGCVDHESPAPIVPMLPALVDAQRDQVFRDSASAWLEDEAWGPYRDNDGFEKPGRNNFEYGVPSKEMQSRYVRWCEINRERHQLSTVALGMRLKELGWVRTRGTGDGSGYRSWSYVPPPTYIDPAAPSAPFEEAT